MANLMFIVPRANGGGAERVITALASDFSADNKVYLVTMTKDNGLENYPLDERVELINLYSWQSSKCIPSVEKPKKRKKPKTRIGRAIQKISVFFQNSWIRIKRALWNERITPKLTHNATLESRIYNSEKKRIQTLKEMKRELKIDCAVSFLTKASYDNAMSRGKERVIVSVRSCLEGPFVPEGYRSESGRFMIKKACELADHVVPVAKGTAESLVRLGLCRREKLTTIYNYCDPEQICADSKAAIEEDSTALQRIRESDFVCFTTGRLVIKKGQWHLIRAFKEAVKRNPHAVLAILGRNGKGDEDASELLEETIRVNHLEENVFLLGFRGNPYPYLKLADVYVMSSFNEGFPNALVEAMALGIPVISSDCHSGPREILAPETDFTDVCTEMEWAPYGILVPECSSVQYPVDRTLEQSEEELSKALIILMEDGALRREYGQKAKKRAEMFSREAIIQQWNDLIM